MASIIKLADGRFRAHVHVNGQRASAIHAGKREAQLWASRKTVELKATSDSRAGDIFTLKELLTKYLAEVTEKKRGKKVETARINRMIKHDLESWMDEKVSRITEEDLKKWKLSREGEVSPGALARDMGVLSNVFTKAVEWKWIKASPMSGVEKPPKVDHRERIFEIWEVRLIMRKLGWKHGQPGIRGKGKVAVMLLLALRTGMRAGELHGLEWNSIKLMPIEKLRKGRQSTSNEKGKIQCNLPVGTAYLPKTKNGSAREVPLSQKAVRLVLKAKRFDSERVFPISSTQYLDKLFNKARVEARLKNLKFHDSRHTAATWMAPKVNPLALCKIFGWKRIEQAMVYYNPKPIDFAVMI
jgi:integrase